MHVFIRDQNEHLEIVSNIGMLKVNIKPKKYVFGITIQISSLFHYEIFAMIINRDILCGFFIKNMKRCTQILMGYDE